MKIEWRTRGRFAGSREEIAGTTVSFPGGGARPIIRRSLLTIFFSDWTCHSRNVRRERFRVRSDRRRCEIGRLLATKNVVLLTSGGI